MGDPKKARKKYSTPTHPWKKQRIDEENVVQKDYGLKNKKEIWRVRSMLKRFQKQAKVLSALNNDQAEREKLDMLRKLESYKLIEGGAGLNDVLNLTLADFLNRRLQTLMVRQGLCRTMKQARQFIVHRHVMVNGKIISSPSFMITRNDEGAIAFVDRSSLKSIDHPERVVIEKKEKKERKPRRDDRSRRKPVRMMRK